MYTNVWAKYLPVIRIVLKRSLASEQVLALNAADFLRAGLSRKLGYHFTIKFKNGKVDNVIIDQPIASSLVAALKADKVIKDLFADKEFHISLNPKFELGMKHIPVEEVVGAAPAEKG